MFIELVEAWRVHRIVSSENGKGYFLQKKCIFLRKSLEIKNKCVPLQRKTIRTATLRRDSSAG